ncbi:hypothetical protein F7725_005611 [Dissostichus mawsoni]|uniref:Uncharacterized protein n=5 Tax=Notothenioidei TaxID=8205 RepID=A0A7J5YRX6_DISMA|nr:hypothetical protein F7725_005611 [Dissostichus mawsoni]
MGRDSRGERKDPAVATAMLQPGFYEQDIPKQLEGADIWCCALVLGPPQNGPVQSGNLCSGADRWRMRAPLTMVSPTMKALVDAVWGIWSIGASIYDYIHTNAMEERIHALEDIITIHQCVIGLLSTGVLVLFTYVFFKKL